MAYIKISRALLKSFVKVTQLMNLQQATLFISYVSIANIHLSNAILKVRK